MMSTKMTSGLWSVIFASASKTIFGQQYLTTDLGEKYPALRQNGCLLVVTHYLGGRSQIHPQIHAAVRHTGPVILHAKQKYGTDRADFNRIVAVPQPPGRRASDFDHFEVVLAGAAFRQVQFGGISHPERTCGDTAFLRNACGLIVDETADEAHVGLVVGADIGIVWII